MVLLELTSRDGQRFLFDMESQWEIWDDGDKPAVWTNYQQGRNLYPKETYEAIKFKFKKELTR